MILKEAFSQSTWQEVWSGLSKMFPDYVEHKESYRMAHDDLNRLDPHVGNIRLVIGRFDPGGIIPFYVIGFDGDCPKGFSLKLSPWNQWLGVRLDEALLSQYTIPEVVAICLYDMTWAGFTSKQVGIFREDFIRHEDWMLAVYGLVEQIEASEPHLVRRKQRSDEIYEAVGLQDFESIDSTNESPEHRQARLDLEVEIYCLGESENDYDAYCSKVRKLRKHFRRHWPNQSATSPQARGKERL